jgi:Universal stress protein family
VKRARNRYEPSPENRQDLDRKRAATEEREIDQVLADCAERGGGFSVTPIKKILCAIDLTKASRNAFDRALGVARVSKARLYILHAVPPTKRYSWRARERLDLLTKLRQRAEREGVLARVVEQHGDPAGTIVLHANSRKADLVVLWRC